jgi:uncharacterized protein YjbJ (UPF0337 family)
MIVSIESSRYSLQAVAPLLLMLWWEYSKGGKVMNNDKFKGKWHQLKGEIKRKWGKMTDDDLTEAEGDMEKLVGKIQQRTGERREAIEKWLDSQTV